MTLLELISTDNDGDFIKEYLYEKALNKASSKIYSFIKKTITKSKHSIKEENIDFIDDTIIQSVLNNIVRSYNWSKEINFSELSKNKKINHVFIQVDFFLTPSRLHLDHNEKRSKFEDAINVQKHNYVILGAAGAGKTTLLNHLCLDLFEIPKDKNRFICPITIRLRDISYDGYDGSILYSNLLNELGINLKYSFKDGILQPKTTSSELEDIKQADRKLNNGLSKSILINFLETYPFIILIDGFDELPDYYVQGQLLKEFKELCLSLSLSKLVLTSRTADFHYTVDNCHILEICPLTDSQIKDFVYKWIENVNNAKKLLLKIKKSTYYDVSLKPLNLAHLCAIYERYGDIPEKPSLIYEKIFKLLIEDWDSQRNIVRPSKYATFITSQKILFLSELAYILTVKYKTTVFNTPILKECYLTLCEDYKLPKDDATKVVNEIESHTGIFIQSGYNRFEFSHKSLQEYLTAEYIKNLGVVPYNTSLLLSIPNELAICVSLSTNSSVYLYTLYNRIKENGFYNDSFTNIFINRLIVERPDFRISPYLALFVIDLYEHVSSSEKSIYQIDFENIYKFNNLKKSFELLNIIYNMSDVKKKGHHEYYLLSKNNSSYNKDLEYPLPETIKTPATLVDKYLK